MFSDWIKHAQETDSSIILFGYGGFCLREVMENAVVLVGSR
jgi:hypothetical protein